MCPISRRGSSPEGRFATPMRPPALQIGAGVGTISKDSVWWGTLRAEDGLCLDEKVEGVAFHPTRPDRVFVCIDPDDAARPTELCEVELRGPWPWLR